jgi:4'-phosphopantetheinyl transferase
LNKMNILPWQESRKEINLSSEDTQIWFASFEAEDSSYFIPFLSEDEKKRSARLRSNTIACRHIISHGILRLLLSNYTGVFPNELIFENNSFGKPFISNPVNSKISFNLSHSGGMLLIAVVKDKQVGIDVEKIEEKRDFKGMLPLVFSLSEQQTISRSGDPIHDFYSIWTAKEAILKAAGRGFSYPSNKFSVFILNGITFPGIIPTELTGGCSCSLSSFSPASGYSAAIAVLQ